MQTEKCSREEGGTLEADARSSGPNPTDGILNELIAIKSRNIHTRRYRETILDISEMLYSLSPRAYRLLRQILPVSSPKSLWRHYGYQVKRISAALSDYQSPMNVMKAVDSYDLSQSNTFTLAIDAFAFRSFTNLTVDSSKNTDKTPTQEPGPEGSMVIETLSNGFMFLLIPLCSQQEPRLLHIAAKTDGSYDSTIHELYLAIKHQLEERGVKLWFKATDGDPYLSTICSTRIMWRSMSETLLLLLMMFMR